MYALFFRVTFSHVRAYRLESDVTSQALTMWGFIAILRICSNVLNFCTKSAFSLNIVWTYSGKLV